jgi:aspartate ammonia-lyase
MHREIDLILQYLRREREKHLVQAHRMAVGSKDPSEYSAIVGEAKAAAVLEKVISDVKLLDSDAGEFIKRYLT